MDVRQSIIAEVTNCFEREVIGADVATLLRLLLLFERVVVKSIRLKEVPYLVRTFGDSGFLDLLNLDVLQISSNPTFLVGDLKVNGCRQLPLFHYDFGIAEVAEPEAVLKRELVPLQGISGLRNAQRALLERTILEKLVRPPAGHGAEFLAETKSDIRNNSQVLLLSFKQELRQRNMTAQAETASIRVEETQKGIFHVITNLRDTSGISDEETHSILWLAMQAVGNINKRVSEMAAYSAITGFAESEAPLLFGKFASILSPFNPKPANEQFARVLSLADFPELNHTTRIDVEKLLKVRDSAELREFRRWLLTLDKVSDKEITDMIGGVRNKVGSTLQTTPGKLLRLAVTTGLGLISVYGLAVGPAASAIDSFLMDKLFPTSGVVAFLTKTYPSLFESSE